MLKRLVLYLMFYLGCIPLGKGQNLVPDPSFDALTSDECIWPNDVLERSVFWYVANPTPDWFVNGCPPHPNAPFASIQEGQGSIGLRMDLRRRGFHYSEAIGTPLIAPMEEDKLYYFEMDIRNRGLVIIGQEGGFTLDCTLTPEKDVRVYTATDSIFFIVDDDTGDVATNANELFVFQGDFLSGYQETFPEIVGRCMMGDPSVRHLAIAPRYGNFDIAPPCVVIDSLGFFSIVYFEVDDVKLEALPARIDTSLLWCTSEPDQVIDLSGLFDERALESVTYTWADGTVGTTRAIQEAGTYEATINLDCGTIPISVSVAYEICEAEVFIPNAFSPNDDGINDNFGPFIEVDFPISSYSFQVYDRWGALLFDAQSPDDTWDGATFGRAAASGVYVWVLEYSIAGPNGSDRFREMGDVLLVR